MFTKADSTVEWLTKNGSELFNIAQAFGWVYNSVVGKKIPDDAPEGVKKMAEGIRGFGDEIDFTRRMLQEGDLDPEEIDAITGFQKWHFFEEPQKKHGTRLASIIAWYRMNQWRMFVMNLDSPVKEVKKSETKGKDGKIEYDRIGGGEATKFLKEIAAIINSDTPKTKPARYRRVLEHHRVRSIPTMPDHETLTWWGKFFSSQGFKSVVSTVGQATGTLRDSVHQEAERIRAEKAARRQRRRARRSKPWLLVKAAAGKLFSRTNNANNATTTEQLRLPGME